MNYDIKAIPTVYNGVNFRSRLEAKWAAFFDELNIEWEYEPFELNGWFPDFLLKKPSMGKGELLVEVKPIDFSDKKIINLVAAKMKKAHDKECLLLGQKPYREDDQVSIGLLIEPGKGEFDDPYIDSAVINYFSGHDIAGYYGSYVLRLSGYYDGNPHPVACNWVDNKWKEACNKVQWRKA